MSSIPLYFGAEQRARFGLLNWPATSPRGAAVICPPLGYENVCARESLRLLAEGLAARGVACLRVDYDGTENSIGADIDEQRVEAWIDTIADAIGELRSFGLQSVTLIGLTFGALLANQLASRPDVTSLVEWDPPESGRRYARMIRVMAGTTGTEGPDEEVDGVVFAGTRYPDQTLKDMARLRHVPVEEGTASLVIERSEAKSELSSGSDTGAATTDESGAAAERVRLSGNAAMLERTAETARVPTHIIEHIIDWVDYRNALRGFAYSDPTAINFAQTDLRRHACETVDGRKLVHGVARVGVGELLTVTTQVEGSRPTHAVVMTNNGKASFIGPGRSWVEFASRFAGDDTLVVRLDLSGLGDSPARPGRRHGDEYTAAAAQDFRDVGGFLRDEFGIESVSIVGLCSGALLAFDGALACPLVTGIVSINPRFDKPFRDRRPDHQLRAAGQSFGPLTVPLSKAPLARLLDRLPGAVWRFLALTHVVASPTTALRRVLERGRIHVTLVFSRGERGLRVLQARTSEEFAKIRKDPNVDVTELPMTDHNMFDLEMRRVVGLLILDRLATTVPNRTAR